MVILELFAPLLKKRDTYYVVALVVLALWLRGTLTRAKADEAALAARPAVSDDVKRASDFHEQKGKVTIVDHYLPAPPATAACPNPQPQLAERDTTIEPSIIDRHAETEHAHTEIPACPAPRHFTRYFGFVDGLPQEERPRVRAGLTFNDRLDLGVAYDTRFSPLNGAVQAEASWRF